MDLDTVLKDILRDRALTKCFEESWFTICPINTIHTSYPNRKVLLKAHCVEFECMSDEMIVELKSLVREAVYYEKPWWRIF